MSKQTPSKEKLKEKQEESSQVVNEQQQETNDDVDHEENNQEKMEDIFSVYVNSLTGSQLKIQISRNDSTVEIKQLLSECVETCYITSYDLLVGDRILEDFSDIGLYEEIKPNAVITMQPANYDDKGARMHVYRLRELLFSKLDQLYLSAANAEHPAKSYHYSFPSLANQIPNEPYNDLANALNCDLEFMPVVQDNLKQAAKQQIQQTQQSKNKKKNGKSESTEDDHLTQNAQQLQNAEEHDSRNIFNPQKFTLRSMEHLLSLANAELPKCVTSITFSGFNPPSGNRKLRGDLFYLEVQTIEGKTFHITATTDGFFLNASQGSTFSSNAVTKPQKSHTLLGLLWELSPAFKKEFPKLLVTRTRRHPFEVTPVPYNVPNWIGIPEKHSYDVNRSEDSLFTILGNDPRIQQREWNEEYQSSKELPSGTLEEKLIRDRTLFKIHCDFVDAATKGAKAVVDKALLPINPIDPQYAQVYIQNNIFFSFAIDNKEKSPHKSTSMELDQHAYANANNDLKGVKAFNDADVRGLHTLATAIVDYKGYRVVAQSIIPGILQGDQGSKHVYGSIDEGNTFTADEKYHKVMSEAAQKLHLKEHTILDKDSKKHTLCCHADCKGIVGSDGRFYVLDLTRTTPRDANFLDVQSAILRPELVKFYERYRFSLAVKEKQQQLQQQKKENEEQDSESKALELQQEIESIKLDPILFNPDVFCKYTLDGSAEDISSDEKQVKDIAQYLKDIVLNAFIHEVATTEINPLDGATLTEAMHDKGINMRYLGMIATEAEKKKLPHLKLLCEQEMLTRAAKHEFTQLLRSTPDERIAKAIESFLNSFLGSEFTGAPISKKKKKKLQSNTGKAKDTIASAASLKEVLKRSIEKKYLYTLSDESITSLPKLSTLRNFALKVGLVLTAKDYTWNSPTPFDINDILDLQPVVKHSTPKCATAHGLLEIGKQQLNMGQFESAFEFLSQAIVMFQQVKGPMNPQVSTCFSFLASILFHATDLPQSVLHQHKALVITRRVLGVDSAITCQLHQLLGMLCHHMGQTTLALKHFLRAKYILEVVCGLDHPDLSTALTNIAMMYQELGDVNTSIHYLKEALRVNLAVLGDTLPTATTYHAIAVSYSMIEKHRDALDYERKSYEILNKFCGKNDMKTQESSNWLNHFARLAVAHQMALQKENAAEASKVELSSNNKAANK